jgi:ATP-binding cassette subfamily E protein 1
MEHEQTLIGPLDLHDLLERNLNELSGGQLQRVAIAKCLGEKADLYLLDEPAAYLDVEQRLRLSKIIRELLELRGKACIVVDHDLLFLDYLCDKLIVFTGTPAVKGAAEGPFSMADGMNVFLRDLNVTFRRDEDSKRPRVNKEGSVKDKEQKSQGKLYYTG